MEDSSYKTAKFFLTKQTSSSSEFTFLAEKNIVQPANMDWHFYNVSLAFQTYGDGVTVELRDDLHLKNAILDGAKISVKNQSYNGQIIIDGDTQFTNGTVKFENQVSVDVSSGMTLTMGPDVLVEKAVLAVESGGSLEIQEGSSFKFNGGTGIDAAGRIIVNGTSSNPVEFDRFQSTDYDGITIHGSGADNSEIEYAEIYNAKDGIVISGSASLNVVLDHVTVSGSDHQNLLVDTDAGVMAYASVFSSSNGNGAVVDDAYAYFREGSEFLSNAQDGVYSSDGFVQFGDSFEESYTVISNNASNGIEAYDDAYVMLGYWEDEYMWVGGWGTVHSNSSHELRATSGSEIRSGPAKLDRGLGGISRPDYAAA